MKISAIESHCIFNSSNSAELLEEYAAECSIAEIGSPDPQPESYERMEKSGSFQVFGVFDGEILVGFATILIYLNPHYNKKIAAVESLFLSKDHRKWRTGNKLMGALEIFAVEQECAAILYSAPAGGQFEKLLGMLLPYRKTNSVFCRSLG